MSQRRASEIAFLRRRDEEVDEMIPETDVDDTQCSEQIVGHTTVEVVHNTPLQRIPERIVAQIVDMQVQVVGKIIRVFENQATSGEHIGQTTECLKTGSNSEQSNKL